MVVSKKVMNFMDKGSWIRKMFEEGIALKQEYGEKNVFDLSLGNPELDPPVEFFERLTLLANNPEPGMHRYMPNSGYIETRTSVASQLSLETGLEFTCDHILMTCGAGGALNVVMKTLLNPGDEVIIFEPYFVEYMFYADNHGGVCKSVPFIEGFIPNLDVFEKTISQRTKIVLVSSPGNPTGIVYSEEILSRIGQIIRLKEQELGIKICLVSDEPYRKILFDGAIYPQIFPHHRSSIVVTSHSKDLAIPGERIGFIAVNPFCDDVKTVMEGLTFCNRTLGFVNAPALMQHLVKYLQHVTVDVEFYQKKRDFLFRELTSIGYSITKPGGAFYMFPKSPLENDVRFVDELRKNLVLVVPGTGFGAPGYFRLSYCVNDSTLENSIAGFRKAFESVSL